MFKTEEREGYDYDTSDASFPASAWPSTVICIPYDQCVIVDVDQHLEPHGAFPMHADAVVQTDRGQQWVYVGKVPKADAAWVKKHIDEEHVKISRENAQWKMRAFSKNPPHVRRTMHALTEAGECFAAEWNETVKALGVFQKEG